MPSRVPAKQQTNSVQVQAAYFNGPLPPPDILAKYNDVLPGAADRIIAMAEKQAEHRQELEKIAVTSRAGDSRLGVVSGLIIGVVALLVGGYVIGKGHTISGILLGGGSIAGLVGVFVYGTRSSSAERIEKNRPQ